MTEGEELIHLINSMGRLPRGWAPTLSQRTMCDQDTNRRISQFAPWDYSPSARTSSAASPSSATPYYSSTSTPSPAADVVNSSNFASEFHDGEDSDSGGASDVSGGGSSGVLSKSGDDGALYESTLADGRRALAPEELASYRARLGRFLAAFARVDSDPAHREPDSPEIARFEHRHVFTGRRGRGPFDYESELGRDRPEP